MKISYRYIVMLAGLMWLSLGGAGGFQAVAAPLLNTPVYNPETRSYFELVEDRQTTNEGPSWFQARVLASKRYFKGVRGRLAIIPSAETEMFIRTELRPKEYTWFGLVFDCRIRNLVWVNGKVMKPGAYSNWDPVNWNRGQDKAFCPGNMDVMPAFLTEDGVNRYWALQLPGKRYYDYLVEYPTDGRDPTQAAIEASKQPLPSLISPKMP